VKQQKQSGFAHLMIITGILALAVVGLLGFVFYQNFIQKKYTAKVSTTPFTSKPTHTSTDPTADWQTYTNVQNGYSIKYPSTWAYREYQDGSGAAFRLKTDSDIPANDIVGIMNSVRPTNYNNMSFEEYVKIAGPQEVQGYNSVASISKVTTNSGTVGYDITWNASDLSGKTYVTSPVSYFPSSNGSLTSTNEVSLSQTSSQYLTEYNELIKTYQFTN
jgi:hypothetical protein